MVGLTSWHAYTEGGVSRGKAESLPNTAMSTRTTANKCRSVYQIPPFLQLSKDQIMAKMMACLWLPERSGGACAKRGVAPYTWAPASVAASRSARALDDVCLHRALGYIDGYVSGHSPYEFRQNG